MQPDYSDISREMQTFVRLLASSLMTSPVLNALLSSCFVLSFSTRLSLWCAGGNSLGLKRDQSTRAMATVEIDVFVSSDTRSRAPPANVILLTLSNLTRELTPPGASSFVFLEPSGTRLPGLLRSPTTTYNPREQLECRHEGNEHSEDDRAKREGQRNRCVPPISTYIPVVLPYRPRRMTCACEVSYSPTVLRGLQAPPPLS